ncbi:hypothetical protein OEZ86_009174 [Tetradesmus obliquus]|nr:hypothetical protein OEZ86_009174 [Tetradesmus obliquus]
MLLLNAIQMEDPAGNAVNAQLVAMLLALDAPLEAVWLESGETPLLMAAGYDDVEIVQVLVAAGANLEAVRQKPPRITALVDAALRGKTDIMQILLDAGADFSSFIQEGTDYDYDLVQAAANAGQFEAVVKLVEAGASWRLARGQPRIKDGIVYYVPEMLCINKPGLKVGL